MSTTFAALIAILLGVIALIHLASMTPQQRQALRIRHLRRQGLSQRRIAAALGISRYRVRVALA